MDDNEKTELKKKMLDFCKNQSKDYYNYENLKPLYR